MTDEGKDHENNILKENIQSNAFRRREIPSRKDSKTSEQELKAAISDQNMPWVAVQGSKSAIIVNDRTQVEIVDVFDAGETRNEDRKVIQMTQKVLAIAFSACEEFVAIADAAGVLYLYKSNGTLIFGHPVVPTDGSDSVVCVKFAASRKKVSSSDLQDLVVVTSMGSLLRLRDLRLAELEQKLLENTKDMLSGIWRNVRFERTTVGRLIENAVSCMLVHRFQTEQYVILGNHAAFMSVWKTSVGNQEDRTGIQKVSMCDSRSASIDAIVFDGRNYNLLILLSGGKLSWWNWRDMTELFQADVIGVLSFAVLKECIGEEDGQDASLLAVARISGDARQNPLLQLVRIKHPEPGGFGNTCVVSTLESTKYLETRSVCIDVALFASARDANRSQAFAACRNHHGVATILLKPNDDGSEADESFASKSGEVIHNEDVVSIAKSLVDTSIASLLHKRSIEKYQALLHACTYSIGNSDDESRAVLKHLLGVAAGIREFTSSSPRSLSLSASLLEWCDEISELSYKWTTFQLLRSSTATETEGSENTLRKKWHLFRTMPMLEMLKKYIKLGSIRAVKILWGRHLDGDTLREIGKLLQLLPTSLPVAAFGSWIQNEVIPSLARHAEQSQLSEWNTTPKFNSRPVLTELICWLLERSEAAAAKNDLDTAIRICDLLRSVDSTDSRDCSFYEFQLQASASYFGSPENSKLDAKEPDVFERMKRLSQNLHHIKHLAVKHQFIISISAFEDETPATIAMSMLDRAIGSESLKMEIGNHVRKYLHSCGIDIDPVLYDYVAELAESIQTSQSVKEARSLVLLDEISDVDVRVDATLCLLRSALPPYSQALKRYANNCICSWKTDRLEQIEEHVRLMEIQDMLATYGVKQFDLADAKSASRLVSHILNHVSRPTALTDAMLLVDAYSDLQCDRAAVQFTENLLSDYDAVPTAHGLMNEVSVRVAKAMQALAEVKKRKEPKSNMSFYVSIMEEIIAFGVMLLEMEAQNMDDAQQNGSDVNFQNGMKSQSFIVWMLKSLVAAYLSELEAIVDLVGTSNGAYTKDPEYLLSHVLLVDLQRICQIEVNHGLLLSVSVLRDPEKCKMKLKQLMKPEIMFAGRGHDAGKTTGSVSNILATSVDCVIRGKGKKRVIVSSGQCSPVAAKRQRAHENGCSQPLHTACHRLQQNNLWSRLDLNRLASAVGIDSKTCNLLIAQNAAKNGFILQASRISQDLFSKRLNARINHCKASARVSEQSDSFDHAEALKKIALSLSLYTSRHAQEIYDFSIARNHQLSPARIAQVQAPMYTMKILAYVLCMCIKETFDETLVLLKNTMLVNEVLQFTQHSILSRKSSAALWTLYTRWYRGDACALPSYEAMKLASRFAIAEHKSLRREVTARDTNASKRYVSFLAEQRADLLSLQVLLSMQELPEDAVSAVKTQTEKLLSTVVSSQEIDRHLALGLMLSIKHEDAFHAFRRQISRENVVKDDSRLQHLACIGADAARAWQQIAFLHQCVELEGNARWWHYLKLLGIECNYKSFQGESRDMQYIRRLVPKLITRSNFDFYTVLEFTRHYQIEDSFTSLAYAEALVLGDSASNLEYQDKIAGVIDDIHEQHLVKLLLKSIPKVSGQDYDRLLFILRLLLEKTSYPEREEVEKRVAVLRTLKLFSSFQTQGDLNKNKTSNQIFHGEVSAFNSIIQDGKVDAKAISFHDLIAEPRVILAQLVTKESFDALIGLAEPLGLELDELQMLLLKNMITRNMRRNCPENSNSLAQFSAFEGILTRLSDTESRVTAAEWLAESFPLGEEKLKALEFSRHAAVSGQKGCENPSNNSFAGHNALTRLEMKILRVKVEMLLRNVTLQTSRSPESINDKEQTNQLLALLSHPKKLFLELFRRYALWFSTHCSEMLHMVANSIGQLLQLPQTKLRLELVHEWLVTDAVRVAKHTPSECTKEDLFELLEDEKLHRADDVFVKKMLYVVNTSVQVGDSFGDKAVSYLIEFARDSRPRAGVAFRAKMRALRVILRLGQLYQTAIERYVTTKNGIENSDTFLKDLLDYTKHCRHMVALEEHRVPYDMDFVVKSNKEILFSSSIFIESTVGAAMCRSLMLDFGVEASDLWEDVLTSMMQLGMVKSLSTTMGPLSRKSFARSLECGRQIWEGVLISPMIQLKHKHNEQLLGVATHQGRCDASTSAQETKEATLCFAGIPISNVRSALERTVSLLQSCPFLDQVDVPAFVIHLRDLTALAEEESNDADIVKILGLDGFAVKCALIIPKPVARFEALMQIIRAGAYGSVLHELLDTSCFLNGEQSEKTMRDDIEIADNIRLIQESFSEAAKREDYSPILSTPFEPGFVEYLAATADIDYLLSLLLEETRMEAALNAVKLYYKYHPPKVTKPVDDNTLEIFTDKRWKLIDEYLVSSNSSHLERYRMS